MGSWFVIENVQQRIAEINFLLQCLRGTFNHNIIWWSKYAFCKHFRNKYCPKNSHKSNFDASDTDFRLGICSNNETVSGNAVNVWEFTMFSLFDGALIGILCVASYFEWNGVTNGKNLHES